MQEYFEIKQEQERREPIDKKGFQTPEFSAPHMPTAKPCNEATKYITISVAEYHILTKAAAMLEVIISDPNYDHTYVVNAVAEAMRDKSEKAGDTQ